MVTVVALEDFDPYKDLKADFADVALSEWEWVIEAVNNMRGWLYAVIIASERGDKKAFEKFMWKAHYGSIDWWSFEERKILKKYWSKVEKFALAFWIDSKDEKIRRQFISFADEYCDKVIELLGDDSV